jgi:hypothetical protein
MGIYEFQAFRDLNCSGCAMNFVSVLKNYIYCDAQKSPRKKWTHHWSMAEPQNATRRAHETPPEELLSGLLGLISFSCARSPTWSARESESRPALSRQKASHILATKVGGISLLADCSQSCFLFPAPRTNRNNPASDYLIALSQNSRTLNVSRSHFDP